MPPVDRNILRIAAFELLYCEEIPPKVTLNEAIELGKQFGSEESGSFINGILDRIMSKISPPKTIATSKKANGELQSGNHVEEDL